MPQEFVPVSMLSPNTSRSTTAATPSWLVADRISPAWQLGVAALVRHVVSTLAVMFGTIVRRVL